MNAVNVKATEVEGFVVRNSAGEDLGKISDVLVMAADGRIPFVAVAFGGFLGLGEKVVPVPTQAIKLNAADKVATIEIPVETLQNAPNVDPGNWPTLAVEGWDKQYLDYWNSTGLNLQAEPGQAANLTQGNAPLQSKPEAAPAAGAAPARVSRLRSPSGPCGRTT